MLVGVVVENFQKCRDIIEKDRMAAEKEKEEREKRVLSGKLIIPGRLLPKTNLLELVLAVFSRRM